MVRIIYFCSLVLTFLVLLSSLSPVRAEKLVAPTAILSRSSVDQRTRDQVGLRARKLAQAGTEPINATSNPPSTASPSTTLSTPTTPIETTSEEDDDLNNANLGESKLGINSTAGTVPEVTSTAPEPDAMVKPPSISNMTIEEKIGQLLIVGFPESEMSASLEARLKSLKPGGVILFGRNIKNPFALRKLTSSLQGFARRTSKVPLLIGLDEEGGAVVRVPMHSRLPSAQTLGRLNDGKLVRDLGRKTGDLLRSVGINMNFAPVLDISGAGEKSFIGTRSYGGDPDIVANLGINFAEGNREEGVIPTFKHFPGLGNSLGDSHQKTPVRDLTLEELISTDLKPFQKAAHAGFPNAMMVAHIGLPKIDPSGNPASLSKIVMTDILRDRVKYQGLVITDDLQMNGAGVNETAAQRAVNAFQSGADMLMVVWSRPDQESVEIALRKAIKDGKISMKRLDASVGRVLEAKRWLQQRKVAASVTWSEAEKSLSVFNSNVYRQLVRSQLGPFSGKHVIAFSSSALALQTFRKTLKVPSSIYHITAQTRASALGAIIDRYPRATFIFGVSHPENGKLLEQLTPDQQSHLIVFNQDSEASVGDGAGFQSVIEVGSLGSAPWFELADELNRTSSQSPHDFSRATSSIPADIVTEPARRRKKTTLKPSAAAPEKSAGEDP